MQQPILHQYLSILLQKYPEIILRDSVIKLIDEFLYISISSDIDGDSSFCDREWYLANGRISWKYESLEKAIETFCPPAHYMNIEISDELYNEIKKYYLNY